TYAVEVGVLEAHCAHADFGELGQATDQPASGGSGAVKTVGHLVSPLIVASAHDTVRWHAACGERDDEFHEEQEADQ
ncbi:MAG: hypothetical protein JO304_24715, partial [Solirubrobacterales bacterium]|nr:hypothetical protein [Solirubrobacterales bacterium]